MIEGVDLYHGDAMVDPTKYDFVFHKATQGTWFTDPSCQERITQVREVGKLAGMYHFMTTTDPIQSQVDFFVQTANPQMGDVLALDFENDSHWSSVANLDLAAMATSFITILTDMCPGHRVLLYCNRSTFNNIVTPFSVPWGDGLWIAEVGSDPALGQLFWQYSSDVVDYDHGYFASLDDAHLWSNKDMATVVTGDQTYLLLGE